MRRSFQGLMSGAALLCVVPAAWAQSGEHQPAVTTQPDHHGHDHEDDGEMAEAPTRCDGTPAPLTLGTAADSRIETRDPRIGDGEARYKLYRFDARAGTRVAITMRSSVDGFDPYVELVKIEGGRCTVVASNDDGGGDNQLNSRLVRTLAGNGPHLVRARSFGADSLGAFTIKVEQVPPAAPPPTPVPIALGQPKNGTLSSTDAQVDEDEGAYYKYYSFTGTAGQRLQITMDSSDFDSYVELGRIGEDGFDQLASNDDGGSTEEDSRLNSRLLVRLRESGPYVIRARSLGGGSTGAFRLAINELQPAAPPPAPIALTVGTAAEGKFDATSPLLPSENGDSIEEGTRPYALYSLAGTAGQSVTVTLGSPDFDTVLDIGGDTPIGFGSVVSNDDHGGEEEEGHRSTDSRLTVRFDKAGTVIIRVSALGSNSSGSYRLLAR